MDQNGLVGWIYLFLTVSGQLGVNNTDPYKEWSQASGEVSDQA